MQGLSKKTAALRSAPEFARDVVHSPASLAIETDVAYQGQMDKTLYFPKPFVLFPQSEDWIPEPEGWAFKGATALKTKHVRFTREQGDFLKKIIDEGTNGGLKIREHDTHQ